MNKKMTRQEANRKILEKLNECIEKFPDWRFVQILTNLNLVNPYEDRWFVESEELLKNMDHDIV